MMPNIERPILQTAVNASSTLAPAPAPAPAPTTVPDMVAPAPLTTAIATPSAPSVISDSCNEENPSLPPHTMASLEISDVEVPLESLQRDLSAANSFHLDHLDDDVSTSEDAIFHFVL